MTREEAQFILQAYRPTGEDAHDPQFEEAFALIGNDPELASWFAREQELDAAIAEKIHSVPAPPNLRAQLLLARKVIHPRPWWRKPGWIAAAALIALLIAVASFFLPRRSAETEFASFRKAMVEASLDETHHLDVWDMDTSQLKQWLLENGGDQNFVLPAGLADKEIIGCKVLKWHGHRVTLLCLIFGDNHVDVFVANKSDLPGVSLSAAPRFGFRNGVTTAAWRRKGKIYFIAGNVSRSHLEQLL